jgi:colanic acid biosynthesis glycosyl transferase WcaI
LTIISQTYPPDPTAVGQHVADVAEAMHARGWNVVVYAASRDYESPQIAYPSVRQRGAVQVRRVPWSSFGKRSIAVRVVAQVFFLMQATVRAAMCRRIDAVLVSTSPPFAGIFGTALARIRRAELIWWVMDLNPDQMIRLKKLKPESVVARVFDWMNRLTLRGAADVIVLDDYMRQSILSKAPPGGRLHVLPPWSPPDCAEPLAHEVNLFRKALIAENARLIMYSGNHGLTNPLDTLIVAIKRRRNDTRLIFAFVGGGICKRNIDELIARENPKNIVSLPYQPLERLRESLSAADVHVVSIAAAAVGVSHSCKIYGAMALGRPVLAIAPRRSHVADIVVSTGCGWFVEHGDVDGLMRTLEEIERAPVSEFAERGGHGRRFVAEHVHRDRVVAKVCDIIEAAGEPSP